MQGGKARKAARRKKGTSPRHVPGGLASLFRKDFLAVPISSTVGDAIRQVRQSAPRGNIFYLYVVDEHGKLEGNVSIRTLLTASDSQAIREVCSTSVVALPENSAILDAYHLFSEARFLSLPIVTGENVLLAVVHAHELLEEYGKRMEDLFEERSRGEIFELLGIQAEDAGSTPFQVASGRLPWLVINIIGGTFSAFFIHRLGGNLKQAVQYLAFVPILLIVAESIGMQTASIVIANLHRASSGSNARLRKLMGREMGIASLLGLACAILLAGTIQLWKGTPALTATIALTVLAGSIFVAFLGNAIPFLFHRFKVDPRVAAGPVMLAVADCTTLLLYLTIALWITR